MLNICSDRAKFKKDLVKHETCAAQSCIKVGVFPHFKTLKGWAVSPTGYGWLQCRMNPSHHALSLYLDATETKE